MLWTEKAKLKFLYKQLAKSIIFKQIVLNILFMMSFSQNGLKDYNYYKPDKLISIG